MQHVFHIHSYINYITALGIIESKKIKQEEVLFILCRGINLKEDKFKSLRIPNYIYYFPFFTLKKLKTLDFLKTDRIINDFYELTKSALNDNRFIFYCPNSMNYFFRLFLSHEKCVGVEYLEDGMDMYLSEELYYKKYPFNIPLLQKLAFSILKLFFSQSNLIKPLDDPFRSVGCHKAILNGISNKSFKNISFGKPIKIVSVKKPESYYDNSIIKGYNHFLLLDAVVEQNIIPRNYFQDFINYFTNSISEKKIAIKFHPFQDQITKKFVIRTFQDQDIEITIIPKDVPFELILFSEDNLKISGIGSSLLNYASFKRSHKIYAFYTYFEKEKKFISSRTEQWRESIGNNINIIKY